MERVKIFEPCELLYPEREKPVRYTEEFLKEIASNTIGTKIVDEHYGKSIGNMTNFTFTDGGLYVDVNSSQSLQKFSPSFEDVTLEDKGDYFLATGGKIVEVASTVKPRLDNSKTGGSTMAEEKDMTNEFLAKEVDRLQKELAKKDLAIERNKEKLENYENLEKEVGELREWKETNQKLLDEQKPIVEQYKQQQEQHREELLEKVSKGNPQLKEQFENFSTENLETYVKLHTEVQPAKGVGAENAPGLNEGDNSGDEPDDFDKALETYKKNHNGELPSFLQNIGGE